jgi:predicted CxxxxCH...CXXCH cytochrome family protein
MTGGLDMAIMTRIPALALAVLVLGGCLTQRASSSRSSGARCTECHGDPNRYPDDPLRSAAPPHGVHIRVAQGATATADPGVGAHEAHLRQGQTARALECDECHVVPHVNGVLAVDAPGHMDGTYGPEGQRRPASVTLGGRALLGGVTATYDPTSHTCTVYCHGTTLAGGHAQQPVWNVVGTGQGDCGGCHGLPPAPPHAQLSRCARCHPTVDDTLTITDPARHIDGVVDVSADTTCNACHGSPDSPAPPVDTQGRSDTTFVSVGAHQSHLSPDPARAISAPVPCGECHTEPDAAEPLSHIDAVAAVVFGPLASAGSATPSWNGTTCATYCHGQTLSGGSNPTPRWTKVDGTQDACGSCHGLPPQSCNASAAPGETCASCHASVINASYQFVDKSLHINGVVDF